MPKEYYTGLRFDPYDPRDLLFTAPPRVLPVRIDNRDEATPVRDQGKEGSCTGHALAAVAEMLYWRKLGNPPDFSERWAYEKSKKYDEWPGEDYDGSSIRGAVKAWSKEGICEEKHWPYKPGKRGTPGPKAAENAALYPVEKYERCLGLENMKHAIHYRGAIIVGASIHRGWFEAKGKKIIGFAPDKDIVGGHAFIMVGYNDSKGFFWVKNSWGSEWGIEGYAGMRYQDAICNVRDAWAVSIPD